MLAVAAKCEVGVTFNSIKMDDTAIGTMSSLIAREVNFCFHHAVSCTWMNSAIPFLLGLRLFFSWIGWPINRGVLDVKFYFSGVQYVDTAIQIKLWRNFCWYFTWSVLYYSVLSLQWISWMHEVMRIACSEAEHFHRNMWINTLNYQNFIHGQWYLSVEVLAQVWLKDLETNSRSLHVMESCEIWEDMCVLFLYTMVPLQSSQITKLYITIKLHTQACVNIVSRASLGNDYFRSLLTDHVDW